MLYELDHPTFVEVIEKPSNVGVKHIVHLLLQERVRQRIQRLMLAAPRSKTVREAEKVLLIDLIEDGGHGVLDDFVFQGRDPQWSFPSIFFLYVHSSRGHRSERSTMHPAMKIDQAIFQFGAHTTATLRHLLRVRPSSSVSKNFPAADRRSDGGARR